MQPIPRRITTLSRIALLATFLAAAPAAQAPPSTASKATLSDATLVTTIDTGKLKGEPTQLGWSPDGAQLFLQLSQRGSDGLWVKPRVFVLTLTSPQLSAVAAAPPWAADYWAWKSGKTGPGTTSPEIELSAKEESVKGTQSSMGGSTYGGGGVDAVSGTNIESARRQSEQMDKQRVITLSLNGRTIGRFVNEPLLPGYTFGWAPQPLGLIAYADESGRLVVMDMKGNHQDVAASRNVALPAWSPDGKQIAYLQKAAKNRWDLYTVPVTVEGR